jgi:hypothetical protein
MICDGNNFRLCSFLYFRIRRPVPPLKATHHSSPQWETGVEETPRPAERAVIRLRPWYFKLSNAQKSAFRPLGHQFAYKRRSIVRIRVHGAAEGYYPCHRQPI